jgi:ParB-like chromosome segregation protein Spo0J
MKIENIALDKLIPYARNPRKNEGAISSVAASIKEFGFRQPLVIDKDGVIVVGHTRLKAAQKLGLKEVPCLRADDLTEQQIKAYRILDNKIAEKADWDFELLQIELEEIELDLGPFEVSFDAPTAEVEPPDDFKDVDENIDTEHECPKCGYKWSGGE